MPAPADPPLRVSLSELFWAFVFTAARGFGGMLPWAHRMLVEERRWLTPRQFTDIFSLCQFLPGPNVLNVAIVTGSRFQGARGAAVAFAGVLTLPLAIVLTLAALYARYGQTPGVNAALRGVAATAAGLVIGVGLRMGAPMVRKPVAVAFGALAFVAIALLRWPLIPVVSVLVPCSVAAAWLGRA